MSRWMYEEPKTARAARDQLHEQAAIEARKAADRKRTEILDGAPEEVRMFHEDWTCPGCGETLKARYANWNCGCTHEAGKEAHRAHIKGHTDTAARSAWALVDVPARFKDKALDTFQPRNGAAKALTVCRTYADSFDRGETGEGLFLFGPYGSGKTHLATATARRILERTFTIPLIISADELVAQHQENDFDAAPIQNAIRAELLVLDDLGQGRATDFRRDVIYRIVGARYENLRPTIITTNLGTAQLGTVYGGALVSRLWEMCQGVELTASDYRAAS